MIEDNTITLLNNGSIAGATASSLFGDVVDLGERAAARDLGSGQTIYANILITKSATAATSKVTFRIAEATTANLDTGRVNLINTGQFGSKPSYAG